jgi:hypothetical protein
MLAEIINNFKFDKENMKWTALFLIVAASCSPGREAVMPFKNLGYSGERLLPVKTSTAEYSFRIWINNSTSVDRVISISKDSLDDFRGYLTEVGVFVSGKKSTPYYRQTKIEPQSGFQVFKAKLDSLNLFQLNNKVGLIELASHQGFSTYVVEVKDHSNFNTFQFDSYYPHEGQINEKYSSIEKLIFAEFNIRQYFKLRK